MTDWKQRIVGGVFGLEEPHAGRYTSREYLFLRHGAVRLASARGAFYLLVHALHPNRVWLPSYLCPSIVEGFCAAGAAMEFFPVGANLRCDSAAWLRRVEPGDLVLRIHYYGFPNVDPVFAEVAALGAYVVDDAAQALLTEGIGEAAEFVVFSLRKFVGLPDGGVLVTRRPLPGASLSLPPPPDVWWRQSLAAVTLRRQFDQGHGNRDWFPKFQSAESNVPAEPHAMSELTGRLLAQGIDFDTIARRRRDNYRLLLELVPELAMFPDLPEGVAPLGFPIRVRQRDALRNILFSQEIFPPVHWPLVSCVPAAFEASHRLAAETMTLPCDQRYDADDMSRVAAVLREATAVPSGRVAVTN